MKLSKQTIFAIITGSLALVSCQTVQTINPEPPAIGKILSAKSEAKICRNNDCVPAVGATFVADDVLKSGTSRVAFQLYGVNDGTTSHRLLGASEFWAFMDGVIKVRHVDGTLSGEVVNQPMRIQFGPSHNQPNRIAYCEFSTGQYRAINYGIFRLEIQNGTAVCIDSKGKKHEITDGAFEE